MAEAVLLAAVAVISFVGGVGTLIPFIASLAGRPMEGWGRAPRVVTAVLLLLSLIAGLAAHRVSERENARDVAPLTQPLRAETTFPLPTTTQPSSFPTDTSAPSRADGVVKVRPATPRLRIADVSGASIPQLVAAAKDLRHEYALDGRLHERSEQSADLQDLYTVHLTLTVTVTRGGIVLAAFSLRSRGGGFQIEAARTQALDRLAMALQERLQEVAP